MNFLLTIFLTLFALAANGTTYSKGITVSANLYTLVTGGSGYTYTAPAGRWAEFNKIIIKTSAASSLSLNGVTIINAPAGVVTNYSTLGNQTLNPEGGAMTTVSMEQPIIVAPGQTLFYDQPGPQLADRIWVWGIEYSN